MQNPLPPQTQTKTPTFLKNERQKTDDSLDAERDKTNQSIVSSQLNTEDHIDQTLHRERQKADIKTEANRLEADSKLSAQVETTTTECQFERASGDLRLQEERDRSDEAIELERTRVDLAFERERELKTALAVRLLEQERTLTDTNLAAERDRTDAAVSRASVLLSSEIADHLKTKVSLTTREEFVAIVSHDLRNPIGAASTCAEMLLNDPIYKDMPSEIRHWIVFIKRNTDRSLRLIRDLLDMERIAEGKLQLNSKNHDIKKIIGETVEGHSMVAAARKIQLSVDPASSFATVQCDRDRIIQVLSNIIGNAIKFTPDGGSVRVSVELQEKEVQISVRDTGPGIPQDKREHIFQRFAQLGSNDRTGLGLGLYISKMLIEAHGGSLFVQSEPNEGSTFVLTLPTLT